MKKHHFIKVLIFFISYLTCDNAVAGKRGQTWLLSLLLILIASNCMAQKQGQARIDSLLFQLSQSTEDTNKVILLNDLSSTNYNINPKEGIKYGQQGLALSIKLNWKKGIANANGAIGVNYWVKSDYSEALECYIKALNIFEELRDQKGIAKIHGNIGIVYTDQGNYTKALDNYFKALKINEELGNKESIGKNFGNIGAVYRSQGDYVRAIDYHLKALKIAEELGDKRAEAIQTGNIGVVYKNQGDYNKALDYFFKAKKMDEVLGNKNGIARHLGNIGNAYSALGDLSKLHGDTSQENQYYTRALEYFFKAREIDEQLGKKHQIAAWTGNIGDVYYKEKNYSKALDYFFKALQLDEKTGEKSSTAAWLGDIGSLYISTKKYSDAKKYLQRALGIANSIGALDLQKDHQNYLSNLYRQTGDYKEALEHYEKAVAIQDTLFNEEKTKKITQLQDQYEFDKKETASQAEYDKKQAVSQAEIESQKKIKKIILGGSVGFAALLSLSFFAFYKNKKEKFNTTVEQVNNKALRSQMTPHFINNSLNAIEELIENNDIEKASDSVVKFSQLMRDILMSSRKEEITLKEDLEALELYIQLMNLNDKNKVDYTMEVAPEINQEETLIPPMLLQPFIENSFKHAFHQIPDPKLEIKVYKKNEMIVCTVKDNGTGRKVQQVKLEEKGKHESVGLRIVQERLDIINRIKKSRAYIKFEDLKDVNNRSIGTQIELGVPVT